MFMLQTSRLILHLRVFAAHQKGSTATWHQTFSIRISDTHDTESPAERDTEAGQQMERIP